MPIRSTVTLFALTMVTGCLPYTVGSTAQTLPPDTTRRTAMVYFIPDAVDLTGDDSIAAPMRGVDLEFRRGLTDRSDIGVRFPSGSGAVVTYKRRLAGTSAPESGAVSFMTGGGFVNFAEHGEVELTMMASGKESSPVTPYGGLRTMQVIPLSRTAVHDEPTAGGFVGLRIVVGDLEVKPELGVYYDPSALGIRSTNYIVVPAFGLTRRR
jgi:hypothetical protein